MNKTRFLAACVVLSLGGLMLGLPGRQAATAGSAPPPQLGTLMPLASPFVTYIPPEVATQVPGAATQIPPVQPPPAGGGQQQQATSTPLPTDTPGPTFTPVPPLPATPTVAPLPTPKKSGGGPCPGSMALVGTAVAILIVASSRRRR